MLRSIQGSGTYVNEYTTNTMIGSMTPPLYLIPISREFVIDLYYARLIEIQIAGIAAERSTPADIRLLKQLNNRLKQCDSVEEHAEIEVAFHSQICKMAGNPLMNDICRVIFDTMKVVFPIVSEMTGSLSCVPIHDKLIDTIEKHYVEEAKKRWKNMCVQLLSNWKKFRKTVKYLCDMIQKNIRKMDITTK